MKKQFKKNSDPGDNPRWGKISGYTDGKSKSDSVEEREVKESVSKFWINKLFRR